MSTASILKKRTYALTIDLAIIVVTNAFLVSSFNHFTRTVFFHLPVKMQLLVVDKAAYMASVSMMGLVFSYFTLFYYLTDGRTLGKSLFHLRAVNADGSEMSLKQAMFRALATFTCAVTGSFLFALSYIRKDEKSLADVFSGMHVEVESAKNYADELGTEFQMELQNLVEFKKPTSAKTPIEEEIEYFEQNKAG